MDRADEKFYVDIRIMSEDTDDTLYSTAATYSDLCYVEEVLQDALAAVRKAMGKA